MTTRPLVSIIVPVYEVEKYIKVCINSILAQTFKRYEIILVDDGSPDNCGKICDEYAVKDNRVVVIHKENGGLSSARNAGIDWAINNSVSEYVLFVDSDDIIKKKLLKKTVKLAKKYDADVVCFGIEMTNENLKSLDWGTMKIKRNTIFDTKNRFAPIVPPYSIGDYAVNKLWRKGLFKDVRYPVGKTFEDVYTTYKLFDKAKIIYLYKKNLYIYRRREGSITKNSAFDEKGLNYYYSSKEKFDSIADNCPSFAGKAITCVINAIYVLYKQICDDEKYDSVMLEFKSFVTGNKSLIFNNKYIGANQLEICKKVLL